MISSTSCGYVQLVDEGLHPVKTGFVKGLEHVKCRKQEGSRTAHRVQNRDLRNRLVHGSNQLWAFRVLDEILAELAEIYIQSH